jgi:type VI secretion system secreted protein VgrG
VAWRGRLYNEDQAPQWHTNGTLSGYKSKEYKGGGFNQLVFDDSTGQAADRAPTASSSARPKRQPNSKPAQR